MSRLGRLALTHPASHPGTAAITKLTFLHPHELQCISPARNKKHTPLTEDILSCLTTLLIEEFGFNSTYTMVLFMKFLPWGTTGNKIPNPTPCPSPPPPPPKCKCSSGTTITDEIFQGSSSIIQGGARLDVAMSVFWRGRDERTFCNVRSSTFLLSQKHSACLSYYWNMKCWSRTHTDRELGEDEHASFTTLVFPATRGLGSESRHFNRACFPCCRKWNYSSTVSWLRCRLTFSHLTKILN